MSQLTTHILDTSKGEPAKGVTIILEHNINDQWVEIGNGVTNDDGRLPGLIPENVFLELGTYRLTFDTDSYFEKSGIKGFYPSVVISFYVSDKTHYHVPLLLNPFGYSTYRGS